MAQPSARRPAVSPPIAAPPRPLALAEADTLVDPAPRPEALVTRLMEAHARGERPMRSTLGAWLRAGVDPDGRCPDGRTALMWAAAGGELGLLTLLVGRGVRVNAVDRRGWTALALAAVAERRRCAAYLKSRGASPHAAAPLLAAARGNHGRALRALLAVGGSAELADGDGNTALIWAAARGHADAVRILLAAGADVHARNASGHTASCYARQRRDWTVLGLLAGGDGRAGWWRRLGLRRR